MIGGGTAWSREDSILTVDACAKQQTNTNRKTVHLITDEGEVPAYNASAIPTVHECPPGLFRSVLAQLGTCASEIT